jgi:hypothetical protein
MKEKKLIIQIIFISLNYIINEINIKYITSI